MLYVCTSVQQVMYANLTRKMKNEFSHMKRSMHQE